VTLTSSGRGHRGAGRPGYGIRSEASQNPISPHGATDANAPGTAAVAPTSGEVRLAGTHAAGTDIAARRSTSIGRHLTTIASPPRR
jgi:hypothetical protein